MEPIIYHFLPLVNVIAMLITYQPQILAPLQTLNKRVSTSIVRRIVF
jgi:hypothetical protein